MTPDAYRLHLLLAIHRALESHYPHFAAALITIFQREFPHETTSPFPPPR